MCNLYKCSIFRAMFGWFKKIRRTSFLIPVPGRMVGKNWWIQDSFVKSKFKLGNKFSKAVLYHFFFQPTLYFPATISDSILSCLFPAQTNTTFLFSYHSQMMLKLKALDITKSFEPVTIFVSETVFVWVTFSFLLRPNQPPSRGGRLDLKLPNLFSMHLY